MGIWDQLNTKTIADNAGTEIQVQSNPVHLQESNRQKLEDIKLINNATLRDGGPIPGTMIVYQATYTDAATRTILTPNKGEVYLYIGSSRTSATIASGSLTYRILLADNVNSNTVCIASESSTGTGQGPLWDGASPTPLPIYIDENISFKLKVSGTLTALQTEHAFVRVR